MMKNKILFAAITAAVLIFTAACSNEHPVDPIISGEEVVITPESSESSQPIDAGEPTVPYEPSESSPEASSEPEQPGSSAAESSGSAQSAEQEPTSSVPDEPASPDGKKDYGVLILVNPTNFIPEDYEPQLEQVQKKASGNGYFNMDVKAAGAAKELLAAAEAAGYKMQLCSGYRTLETSERLYKNKVQEYLDAGYGQAAAEKEAARWVAPPGTSEHHTGLAMDLTGADYRKVYGGALEHAYENFDSFKWMYANCADYGFILRYPKDKQDITGITYEPWHYRYVGVENAKYIMQNGLCLEEFLEQFPNGI